MSLIENIRKSPSIAVKRVRGALAIGIILRSEVRRILFRITTIIAAKERGSTRALLIT